MVYHVIDAMVQYIALYFFVHILLLQLYIHVLSFIHIEQFGFRVAFDVLKRQDEIFLLNEITSVKIMCSVLFMCKWQNTGVIC